MLNNINLIGRVTKDIEVKKTKKSNKNVIKFTLAVDEGKDKKTQFIECIAWEGKAETIAKYVNKGDMFHVSGKLINNNYESNGVKQYSYLVNVEDFSFLPNAKKEQSNSTVKRNDIDVDSDFNFQQPLSSEMGTADDRAKQREIEIDFDDLPF